MLAGILLGSPKNELDFDAMGVPAFIPFEHPVNAAASIRQMQDIPTL